MSWSFNAIGNPRAVLNKARKELGANKCYEVEENIKNCFLTILDHALGAFPAAAAVRIEANGSQFPATGEVTNSLSIKIEPIYGFVVMDPVEMPAQSSPSDGVGSVG